MKVILLVAVAFLVTACASTIQSASVSEAYKTFERQDYSRTLELITRAENVKDTSAEMKAELSYLKAQTYENLGEHETANALFEYLVQEHANSQYAYLATDRLNAK